MYLVEYKVKDNKYEKEKLSAKQNFLAKKERKDIILLRFCSTKYMYTANICNESTVETGHN